jgi:hypothetical protein
MERETLQMISGASDAFVYGEVTDITYIDADGKPMTAHRLEVAEVYADKTDTLASGGTVTIMTAGGFITNQAGEEVKVRALNSPELSEGTTYLAYLRKDEALDAFVPTTGESSVFEVDTDGKVLNIHGFYILDVNEDGSLAVGPPKEGRLRDVQPVEQPPAATVVDIEGNERTVEPAPRPIDSQVPFLDAALTKEQFVAKGRGW